MTSPITILEPASKFCLLFDFKTVLEQMFFIFDDGYIDQKGISDSAFMVFASE